jgi:FKBP-type peptidyl-prolyl cis-trans isomerase 2
VKEVLEESVIVDFNHPLAGKELHFAVEIVAIDCGHRRRSSMNRKIAFLGIGLAMMLGFGSAVAEEMVVQEGKKVKMHYTMRVDGNVVDNTRETQPFEFVFGTKAILPAVEQNVTGLKAGDHKLFTLEPAEAFGEVDPKAVIEVPKARFAVDDLKVGMVFGVPSAGPQPMRGVVKDIQGENVILDLNHPLAGKKVEFDVEILEIA